MHPTSWSLIASRLRLRSPWASSSAVGPPLLCWPPTDRFLVDVESARRGSSCRRGCLWSVAGTEGHSAPSSSSAGCTPGGVPLPRRARLREPCRWAVGGVPCGAASPPLSAPAVAGLGAPLGFADTARRGLPVSRRTMPPESGGCVWDLPRARAPFAAVGVAMTAAPAVVKMGATPAWATPAAPRRSAVGPARVAGCCAVSAAPVGTPYSRRVVTTGKWSDSWSAARSRTWKLWTLSPAWLTMACVVAVLLARHFFPFCGRVATGRSTAHTMRGVPPAPPASGSMPSASRPSAGASTAHRWWRCCISPPGTRVGSALRSPVTINLAVALWSWATFPRKRMVAPVWCRPQPATAQSRSVVQDVCPGGGRYTPHTRSGTWRNLDSRWTRMADGLGSSCPTSSVVALVKALMRASTATPPDPLRCCWWNTRHSVGPFTTGGSCSELGSLVSLATMTSQCSFSARARVAPRLPQPRVPRLTVSTRTSSWGLWHRSLGEGDSGRAASAGVAVPASPPCAAGMDGAVGTGRPTAGAQFMRSESSKTPAPSASTSNRRSGVPALDISAITSSPGETDRDRLSLGTGAVGWRAATAVWPPRVAAGWRMALSPASAAGAGSR